ncbi:MAG TPA: L-threonylcarbamoyladenylate synthase [Candidatus Paceibacterota bacterium]|nr:L-threonylcarbamoyladenylate synthase [Candidatus Paceibacterota bacterium]HMO83237.1 L-threonylcarbamoyladenylate synthase [Candidatus Paceibacterota bacterium]
MNLLELILYPTESVYGLGVNPFSKEALQRLYELKGRSETKPVSWLVRDLADIERYAEVNDVVRKLAQHFLPGPLTLVLELRSKYSQYGAPDGTVGFRVSSDKVASTLVQDWFEMHKAPLTATSANLSDLPTPAATEEILTQFGENRHLITRVVDGGPRTGAPSTVVKVSNDGELQIIRESGITRSLIKEVTGY